MFKPYGIMLASFGILLFLSCIIPLEVRAQGDQIAAEILPSQGAADTIILIRFGTLNSSIGGVQMADIFWDDSAIVLNQAGLLGADNSYNYNITVPTQPPLSDVGNHTIRVDSSVFNYGPVSFNFTFTVTEFVPSPEYLTLNATYYSLLANYTELNNTYNLLLTNYAELSTNYTSITAEHTQLLLDYNSLSANYNSLTANYNSLSANYNSLLTNYNNLQITFSTLQSNYTSLQESFQSLSSSYSALRNDYSSLSSNYSILRSDYEGVLGQLAFDRNLNYVFISSTIILAVTTLYFATKKPKTNTKTRY